jgi:hypothetical protein
VGYQYGWSLNHFYLTLSVVLNLLKLNSHDKPNKLIEGGFIHEDTFLYWG